MDFNGKRSTGVVYDLRMLEHRSLWDPKHPEKPERITSILQRCEHLGLLDRCLSIPPRFATEEEINLIHTTEHIKSLVEICDEVVKDVVKAEEVASQFEAVYFHPSTSALARLSCGSTIDLVRSVADGSIQNGMAIVRPPGHHAMKEAFCGFCYFNNVAIAAKNILAKTPLKRILIVDFDVHHGQGTQQLFYDDPRVLYFSTHRYEHGKSWPSLEESNYNWIGSGDGIGLNCNVPLNKPGLGNTEFLTVWHQILIPLAYQFSPELVIVSAGFDAALGCPEGEMRVSPQCYPHLLRPLMGLANGKVALVLEGGYCLKSLAEGAALSLRTLLGDPCPLIPGISNPDQVIVETVLDVWTMMQEHWKLGACKFVGPEEFERGEASGVAYKSIYHFDRTKPKPAVFPTREFYGATFQSQETAKALDQELESLISTTSLVVAKYPIGLAYREGLLHPGCAEAIEGLLNSSNIRGLEMSAHETKNEEDENILKVVESVLSGSFQSVIAICGGATGQDEKNSRTATAVKHALKDGAIQRILVVDWDVRQDGNKTLHAFTADPRVLSISFEQKSCVEGEYESMDSEGTGYHVNIPWRKDGMGNTEYFAAVTNIILPVAYEYAPQLIIISAEVKNTGDGQFGGLTPECNAHVTHLLSTLANGNFIFLLHGGQNLTSSSLGRGFPWGSMPPLHLNYNVGGSALDSIRNVLRKYAKYWTILQPYQRLLPSAPLHLIGIY